MHGLKTMVLTALLIGSLAACGGTATPPAPTAAPTAAATAAAAAPTSTSVPATPTQAPPVPTAVPPTVQPTVAPVAPVRIAVQLADNSVMLIDLSGGKSLAFKASDPADVASISGYGNVLGDKLYLALSGRTSTVVRIGANGPQTLDWIKGPIDGLAVSANYLAWGKLDQSGAKPTVQIMLSALDGSGVKTALKETVGAAPIVLKPLRWSQDGARLFFGREPSGIGGYILFGGFTNLWSLDPAGGKATELLHERAKNAFVCMDDLSPNEKFVADHCNLKHIEVVDIAANKAAVIDPPANVSGVGLVGGARFSPDSSRVAYGLARHNPDNEQGWVGVSDALSGKSKLVATSPAKDYFSVAAWLDSDTLVLQSNGQTPGIWLARADGSSSKRLADGIFVGILNSQTTARACGEVRTLGPNPPREAAALQAEDCFFKAFQQCQAATLTVTMAGVDAGTINNFALEKQGDNCRITGSVVRYVVPRPTPVPEQFICQGLTRKNGGLLFTACGAQGDIVVPAP
jgi:hypothetical protein